MGKKIDHSSINESLQREIAADVIDIIEKAIRDAHPSVEALASTWRPDPEEDPPNTLLHGETYFDLEDELTTLLVDNFNRKPKKEVKTDE